MLLTIEIIAVSVVLILAILWIINPSGNYEPWTVVCGVITAGIDIYRRLQTKSCNKSDQVPKISEESIVDELLVKAREAVSEVIADRLAHPRLARIPLITLHAVKLEQNGKETDCILDFENLQLIISENQRIIIEAPAGRGKTTTLIQLAECYCKQGEIAFLINLPALVISHLDILEFISKTTPFLSRGIKSDDLARLCREINCIFLLNGWNEISDNLSGIAVQVLAYLEENFPKAKIIIATRIHHIPPPLPDPLRLKLLPLNKQQRTDYLQKELGSRAKELDVQLNSDNILDDLTRTPLFLTEITKIFKSNNPIPKTKVGVLEAVMRLVEQSDEHRVHLQTLPLIGHSQDYLANLAVQMITQGDVIIAEEWATRIIFSVSQKLHTNDQIADLPEPMEILRMLCAHHVLERLDYPSEGYKFEHQLFQEFYATRVIKFQLWDLVNKDNPDEYRRFTQDYLNKPFWEEPFRMIAEEIGDLNVESTDLMNTVTVGKRLIELTLFIDPVFTAELARLCGSLVWKEVREIVGKCLRSWYQVNDYCHKQCALAGMLASGSEDFIDILLPLFTSDDEQIRLMVYCIWDEFHVSSLGGDWRNIVKAWKDEYRATFIGEVVNEPRTAEIAEEFALTDPSPKVRATALQALQWVGDTEAIERVLTAFNDDMLEQILSSNILYRKIPSSLQQRAFVAYERILEPIKDHLERLRFQLKMVEVGNQNALKEIKKKIKEDLIKWPSERTDASNQQIIISALKILQKTDSDWVNQWVAEHIVDGSIWKDYGIELVTDISETFKKNLLEKISIEEINPQHIDGVLSVLAKTANIEIAANIFSRLYKIQVDIKNDPNKNNTTKWAIYRQLEDLLLKIPQDIAVSGLLNSLSSELNSIEFEITIMLFGKFDIKEFDIRSQIPDNLRQTLRNYLKKGISFTLSQDDYNGEMKANLAVALSKIGDPADMTDLYQLIQADIERRRRGRAAILRGENSQLTNGAIMGWSNWYVQAVVLLDPHTCEETLLKILCEPEYEQEAARALVQLARIQNTKERHIGVDKLDYRAILEARSQLKPSSFNEERRYHYVTVIKQRIALIMEQRLESDKPNSFNDRLKGLAYTIAILDGRESTKYVLEIMALPGAWDGWIRVETLKELLLSGARLQADLALSVLNPVIVHAQKSSFNDQQAIYLLNRCLCLLPYVDPPSIGIARIKEVITTTKIFSYQLRELITALGHSQTNEALDLMLELAKTGGKEFDNVVGEWISAIYELHTPESKQVLLSFADPDIKYFEIELDFEYHDQERLASYIANIARDDTTIYNRLISLCTKKSTPEKRHLLANVIAHLGKIDALIAGLNLIHDNANPPVPYELKQGLENAFLEKRPYGDTGNAYTLEPRNANEIRSRLFNMVLNDESRKLSAMALLGQIELWRLEYGRPSGEPKHPALESGEPWPPITRASK